MNTTIVGNYIRGKREQKGWSQEHLAELVDVSQRTIHAWENGKVANIKVCNLENIAYAFEVSLWEVYNGKDMPELDANIKEGFGQALLPVLEAIEERSLLALEIGTVAFGWTIVALSIALWVAIPQNAVSSVLLIALVLFGILFSVLGRRIIMRKPRQAKKLRKDEQENEEL